MLKQGLQQRLLQKLSPQQIQLMKLLEVPTVALEQRIKEEIQINPALEEASEGEDENEQPETPDGEDDFSAENSEDKPDNDPDFNIDDYLQDDEIPEYKLHVNNNSFDDERIEIPYAQGASFQDGMRSQLGLCRLNERQHSIAEQLIGSIDDDGYLRREISSIVDDLIFSSGITTDEEEINTVLQIIQTFDPPGIGARSLQECLLLQLRRKTHGNDSTAIATGILQNYMEEFSRKHYDKIAKHLNLDEQQLKAAIGEILKLNPRPGNSFAEGTRTELAVIPDFIINNREGVLELSLNSRNAPELRVSRSYMDMLETYSKNKNGLHNGAQKEALTFVRQKLESARWFIDAIMQRQQTLLKTMSAIMKYQYDYFLEGDETCLKPMILKDIADRIDMDISTVSRVANSKYVQTPFGTFLLKHFFSEGLQTDSGEEVSSREVKKNLSDCIAAENKKKPVTDDRLAQILKEKGYNIARRTIAKYREQLNLPVARLRKEL